MRCYAVLLMQGEHYQELLSRSGLGESVARHWFADWKRTLDQCHSGEAGIRESLDKFTTLLDAGDLLLTMSEGRE